MKFKWEDVALDVPDGWISNGAMTYTCPTDATDVVSMEETLRLASNLQPGTDHTAVMTAVCQQLTSNRRDLDIGGRNAIHRPWRVNIEMTDDWQLIGWRNSDLLWEDERHAFGRTSHLTAGRDDLPVSELLATIPPPLQGWWRKAIRLDRGPMDDVVIAKIYIVDRKHSWGISVDAKINSAPGFATVAGMPVCVRQEVETGFVRDPFVTSQVRCYATRTITLERLRKYNDG